MVAGKTASVFNTLNKYKHRHLWTLNRNKNPSGLDVIGDFHKSAMNRRVHQFSFRNEIPGVFWKK